MVGYETGEKLVWVSYDICEFRDTTLKKCLEIPKCKKIKKKIHT